MDSRAITAWLLMSAYKLSCFLSRLNRQKKTNQHNRRQNEIAEKQEQNRKKSISSLISSDFRSSPKKYFFGIEFGWCFSAIEVYVCKAEDKLPRDWQGSAEGTSASFFPYFDEHQNMVADMTSYIFCVQSRSARRWAINFVFLYFKRYDVGIVPYENFRKAVR